MRRGRKPEQGQEEGKAGRQEAEKGQDKENGTGRAKGVEKEGEQAPKIKKQKTPKIRKVANGGGQAPERATRHQRGRGDAKKGDQAPKRRQGATREKGWEGEKRGARRAGKQKPTGTARGELPAVRATIAPICAHGFGPPGRGSRSRGAACPIFFAVRSPRGCPRAVSGLWGGVSGTCFLPLSLRPWGPSSLPPGSPPRLPGAPAG